MLREDMGQNEGQQEILLSRDSAWALPPELTGDDRCRISAIDTSSELIHCHAST